MTSTAASANQPIRMLRSISVVVHRRQLLVARRERGDVVLFASMPSWLRPLDVDRAVDLFLQLVRSSATRLRVPPARDGGHVPARHDHAHAALAEVSQHGVRGLGQVQVVACEVLQDFVPTGARRCDRRRGSRAGPRDGAASRAPLSRTATSAAVVPSMGRSASSADGASARRAARSSGRGSKPNRCAAFLQRLAPGEHAATRRPPRRRTTGAPETPSGAAAGPPCAASGPPEQQRVAASRLRRGRGQAPAGAVRVAAGSLTAAARPSITASTARSATPRSRTESRRAPSTLAGGT